VKAQKNLTGRLKPMLILLLILAGIVPYLSSFKGDFVLDGRESILDNPDVHQLWPLKPVVSQTTRPVVRLSFALNYVLGGPNAFGFHLFNLVIHLCAALAVFALVRRTLLSPSLSERFKSRALILSFVTALLWVVHPLNTGAVTYIFQRCESLMALFYLLTIYCSIRYFEGFRLRWLVLAVFAAFCGMGSKAIMVTAPCMVVLYDRLFFAGTFAEGWKKHKNLYLGLAASWILLAVTLSGPYRSVGTVGFDMEKVSFGGYLVSQPGILLHYVRLIFWPHPLILDYDWPVAQGFFPIIVPAVFIITLIVLTIRFYRRGSSFAFLGVWFFLILVPTSGIIPIADLAFEHRMYLSSAGVIAAAVFLIDNLLKKRGQVFLSTNRDKLILCAVVVCLGAATHLRNLDYHDRVKIWEGVIRYRPQNARALYNYGLGHFVRGDKWKAMEYYQKAVELRPDYVKAHSNLGNMYYEKGQTEKAVEHYEKALLLDPEFPDVHNNFGVVLMEAQRYNEAQQHLLTAMRLSPQNADAVKNLGNLHYLKGEYDQAVLMYLSALKIDPARVSALAPLADIYYKQKQYVRAERVYKEILRVTGPSALVHNGLGAVYLAMDRRQDAAEQFREALRVDPGNMNARYNLEAMTGRSRDESLKGFHLGF